MKNNDERIDAVILWVDGSDEKWLTKKQQHSASRARDNNTINRYRDWGLLKYWFRSIEKNAPRINNIYFVSDNQKPKWLNSNHPRLHLVDHSGIIPKKYLPTYNTNVIHYYKIQFYKIIFSGYAHEKIKISYKLAFFKLLGKIYAKHTGINNIIKRYNKLITKNDGNKELQEIISDWPVYGSKKEYQKKANINHYSDCSFEKNTARMFSNYDEILSTTFGDYMTPPPKDKRKSRHSLLATWKASEEING